MRHRLKNSASSDSFSIWTSFTDLMSNAFMVMTLLILLVMAKYIPNPNTQNPDPLSAPPIIVLPSNTYQFQSGLAVLPDNLKIDLGINGKIIKEIEKALKDHPNIDVVEVIGHTDGQPLEKSPYSNLDTTLEKVAHNELNFEDLHAGSNADLGLMRALAVVKKLQDVQSKKRRQPGNFKDLQFRPYSAAQLLLPDCIGKLTDCFAQSKDRKGRDERRRIEIRFTQLGQEKQIKQ